MKKNKNDEEWTQRRIQSIEVGFQVIRAMEAADGALPLRDIAAAAGMPPSKVHLYLVSFVREGVAYQDPATGHYGLGRFAIQLGLSAIRQLDVVELAREELSNLQQASGFACYLSLWGDRGPGIVSKVDGQRQGSLAVRLGYVLPLLTSATGQVFLAYLDDVETRKLRNDEIAGFQLAKDGEEGSAESATVPKDVDQLAQAVRANGYAMTTNSINSNFAALAAPVFDYSGRIVAAMTVLGSDKLIAGAKKKATVGALLEVSKRLSERLGFIERRKNSVDDTTVAPAATTPRRGKRAVVE